MNDTTDIPAIDKASEAVSAGDGGSTMNDAAVTPPRRDDSGTTDEPDTFDRAYVEKLRAEAAANRVKAKDRDTLARELFRLRVAAVGRLADPDDLAYTDELFAADQPELEAAVAELLARKPHLADRRPRGDVDQGARDTTETVDLAGMLRARAG